LGNGAVNSIDLLMLLVLHWGRKDCEPIDRKLIAQLLPIQDLTLVGCRALNLFAVSNRWSGQQASKSKGSGAVELI
jgi:hypothetical protein